MPQAQRKTAQRDWPFQVTPLHDALGVEISGITLAQAVEPKMFDKVYEAFLDHELILFATSTCRPRRRSPSRARSAKSRST
jgi:alpha-ketoglutarate-dependent taurine dioxygenase